VADHPFIFIGQLTVYVFIACVALLLIARARMRKARPTPGIQLSSDRRWWWDGQTWRDAERDVPLTERGRQMAFGGGTERHGEPCRTRPLKPRASR